MESLINAVQQIPGLFVLLSTLIGLLVGSFLNVVIYRLPKMMENEWRSQCLSLLEPEKEQASATTFNLATPASRCPHCDHRIRPWENIPLLSYLLLRGRCSSCKSHISIRYPIIEFVCGLLTAVVAWHFGFGWQALAAMVFSWSLIALTMIDFDHQLLPDNITLPLLWLGLLLSVGGLFVDSHTSLIGAAAGYLVLWSVYWLFKLLTGKEGMGYGDFKLLAVLGAWMGWQMLPVIILLSSVVGAVVGIILILSRGRDRNIPIPFGPYLAAAGWLALIWGAEINQTYLEFSGLV